MKTKLSIYAVLFILWTMFIITCAHIGVQVVTS